MDSLGVGTLEWQGGFINGSPQAVITAPLGRRIKLRIINAAAVFAFKVGIDQVQLSVVGADGNPTKPLLVDEVTAPNDESSTLNP